MKIQIEILSQDKLKFGNEVPFKIFNKNNGDWEKGNFNEKIILGCNYSDLEDFANENPAFDWQFFEEQNSVELEDFFDRTFQQELDAVICCQKGHAVGFIKSV
tara:strand:+ start:139 stop:447 length:309 start_codon:yes stop_codon:yes gene_type:complete